MNLFIDIETRPDSREGAQENARELVKVPANYRKEEVIEKFKDDHAEEAYRKTSLNSLSGEIISIACAINNEDVACFFRLPGESEGLLLENFFKHIQIETNRGQGKFPSLTWIGHNVLDFDLRMIKNRAIVNSVRPPFVIPADAKHGGQSVFDTMKEWAGWKGHVKQQELCEALGIEGKSDGIDGSKVWGLYQNGEFDAIREYNIDDVRIVRELYKRLTWARLT